MRNWGSWLVDSLLVFAATAYLIWPLFQLEYSNNWGSIEATFIADGRFLRENLPHPRWQPNWYGGTRFDYIYPPALRYGTALLSKWLGVSTARSYHLYTAFFYCLGIAGVYVLARVGMGKRGWSMLAALAATTMAPSLLFIPEFRMDYAIERFMPVRLGVLVRYGEGPHMTAFALLGFALACAWHGLKPANNGRLVLAALFAALVVSNNFYGATALALLFPLVVWTVFLVEGRRWEVLARAVAVAALAYGLTAFWLTPSYLRITLRNMRLVSQPGNRWSAVALGVLVAGIGVVSWRWVRERSHGWPMFVSASLALFTLVVLGHFHYGFRVLGEPQRLVPEFDLAFILAAVMVLSVLWRRSRAGKLMVALALWAAIYPVKGWIRRSWQYIPAPDAYEQRIEYKLTQWIAENLPGQRVLATGSLRFWYNAWFDLPQLGGGSEQGTLNLVPMAAYYGLTWPSPPADAVAWMQAMGTDAFVVHDANSQEVYKDFPQPHAYDNHIPVIYDNGRGDRIFQVPRRYRHIARVVDAAALDRIPAAVDGNPTMEQVRAYARAMEEGPETLVDFTRLDIERMRIRTVLGAGQVVVVQESFDPAWRARAGGRDLPVTADAMGFMRIDAGAGAQEILLEFTTPGENRFGQGLTLATVLVCAVVAGRRKRS
jgi:hypothetical protein